jgi:CBS domain-containing protein
MRVLDPVSLVLRKKGCEIWSVPSDATVYSAMEMMADKNVGSLLVVDQGRPHLGERLRAQGRSSGPRFEGHSRTRDHDLVAHYYRARVFRGRSDAVDHYQPGSPSSCGFRSRDSWDHFDRGPCQLDRLRAGPDDRTVGALYRGEIPLLARAAGDYPRARVASRMTLHRGAG